MGEGVGVFLYYNRSVVIGQHWIQTVQNEEDSWKRKRQLTGKTRGRRNVKDSYWNCQQNDLSICAHWLSGIVAPCKIAHYKKKHINTNNYQGSDKKDVKDGIFNSNVATFQKKKAGLPSSIRLKETITISLWLPTGFALLVTQCMAVTLIAL